VDDLEVAAGAFGSDRIVGAAGDEVGRAPEDYHIERHARCTI